MDEIETSTFAQRAAAARSKETSERELRIAQVVQGVLSKPSDGINTRTTATFRGAGGKTFERRKSRSRGKKKPQTLKEQFSEIWK